MNWERAQEIICWFIIVTGVSVYLWVQLQVR